MAVTKEEITELYIAYYDRAPDNAGLEFWLASGFTIEQMSGNFAQQAETKAKYPDTLTTTEYVNTIYQNVFNRDADASGMAYWVHALDTGKVSRGDMIIAIVNGAQGDDQVVLDNKVVVGVSYAEAGLDDYDDAVSIMDDITADSHTVVSAIDLINSWANIGDGLLFTTDRDTLVGASSDDIFKGVVNGTDANNKDTYQGFDGIHGEEGRDTLQITSDITSRTERTIGAAKVSSVEILEVIQNANVNVIVDPSNFDSALTTVIGDSSSTATGDIVVGTGEVGSGSSVKNIVDVELGMSNHRKVVINYADRVVEGDFNEMKVTLTNGVEQELVVNGETEDAIETYIVDTQDIKQSLTIVDAANHTIFVEGDGTLTLFSETAKKIDASAATGSLIFEAEISGSEIIGSMGKDTLTGATNVRIEGGGGADTIKVIENETISYVDQTDSKAGKEDSISGFTVAVTDEETNVVTKNNIIDVSDAVEKSGGTARDDVPQHFVLGDSPMTSKESSFYGADDGPDNGKGYTNVYVYIDNESANSQIAYIDLDQDNLYNAAYDLVIKVDANSVLSADDFIV